MNYDEPQLIFFEGLSGCGKSTLGQQMAWQIGRLGGQADWIYEHQTPHPIYGAHRPLGEAGPLVSDDGTVFAAALEQCSDLVRRLRGAPRAVVFDGLLFQTTACSRHLRGYAPESVAADVQRMVERFQSVPVSLVYLRYPEVGRALEQVRRNRGDWYAEFVTHRFENSAYGQASPLSGFEGAVQFLRAHGELLDRLYESLAIPKQVIEANGDWGQIRADIASFLSLPEFEYSNPSIRDPERFAGPYRSQRTGEEMVLVQDDGHLYLADPARTRLIARQAMTFDVEGMCIQLLFRKDTENGELRGFEMRGQLPGVDSEWVKVSFNGAT